MQFCIFNWNHLQLKHRNRKRKEKILLLFRHFLPHQCLNNYLIIKKPHTISWFYGTSLHSTRLSTQPWDPHVVLPQYCGFDQESVPRCWKVQILLKAIIQIRNKWLVPTGEDWRVSIRQRRATPTISFVSVACHIASPLNWTRLLRSEGQLIQENGSSLSSLIPRVQKTQDYFGNRRNSLTYRGTLSKSIKIVKMNCLLSMPFSSDYTDN